jgi:hypothetical protein
LDKEKAVLWKGFHSRYVRIHDLLRGRDVSEVWKDRKSGKYQYWYIVGPVKRADNLNFVAGILNAGISEAASRMEGTCFM